MKNKQKATKISWPLIIVCVSVFLGIVSWQLCFLEYPYSSIFSTIELFIALVLVSGILQIIYRITQLQITYRIALLLAICFISVGVIPPIYTYWYGISITQKFMDTLGIPVSVESRMINFFDHIHDSGFPRSIHTIYNLGTNRSIVEEEIRRQLKPESGWKFSDERFLATCASRITATGAYFWGTGSNTIWIDENNFLHVLIYYRSLQRCRLS